MKTTYPDGQAPRNCKRHSRLTEMLFWATIIILAAGEIALASLYLLP